MRKNRDATKVLQLTMVRGGSSPWSGRGNHPCRQSEQEVQAGHGVPVSAYPDQTKNKVDNKGTRR